MPITQRIHATAVLHAIADKACGRSWQCACGYCRVTRRDIKDKCRWEHMPRKAVIQQWWPELAVVLYPK